MAYDPLEGRADRSRSTASATSSGRAACGRRRRASASPRTGSRVLRAARFVATLEVEIEPETARAIEPSLGELRQGQPRAHSRRVDEDHDSARAEPRLRGDEGRTECSPITAPELLESVGCEQNRFHAFDVWEPRDGVPRRLPAESRAAGRGRSCTTSASRARAPSATRPTTTPSTSTSASAPRWPSLMLGALRFSNDERERIVSLVRHHLVCYDRARGPTPPCDAGSERVSPELLEDLYALEPRRRPGQGARRQLRT